MLKVPAGRQNRLVKPMLQTPERELVCTAGSSRGVAKLQRWWGLVLKMEKHLPFYISCNNLSFHTCVGNSFSQNNPKISLAMITVKTLAVELPSCWTYCLFPVAAHCFAELLIWL